MSPVPSISRPSLRLAQAETPGPTTIYQVQLAAYRSAAGARAAWRRLVRAHAGLLAGVEPSIRRADLGPEKGVVFQLRVGPFEDVVSARDLCRKLKARGADCFVAPAPATAAAKITPQARPPAAPEGAVAAPKPLPAAPETQATEAPAPAPAAPERPASAAPTPETAPAESVAPAAPPQAPAAPLTEAAGPAPTPIPGHFSGFIAPELRVFPRSDRFPDQEGTGVSLAIQPEYNVEWDDGAQSLGITAFARVDQHDSRRTHVDLREFLWQYAGDGWDLRLGADKVFWGATESNHLIDIVNQTDLVENPDMEDKLGQPMVNLSLNRDWGDVDFYYLPYFRTRTFPGADGRLRTPVPVDVDRTDFEADSEKFHPDLAVRWSRSFGAWDIGLAHFYGTSREPRFLPGLNGAGELSLTPRYDLINQTSLDAQGAVGDWLLKLEAMTRSGHGDRFFAVAGGFEYTFYGVADSAADVGLLLEVSYDGRNDKGGTKAPPTFFDNDVFSGLRFSLNDAQSAELLAGVVTDWRSGARAISVEASRRIGARSKLSLEARTFDGFPQRDFFNSLGRDDHLRIEFAYYF
ncbi:MAG: SPOR domain-containing protein [Alphaproteobacteria bacterium]